MGQTISSVDRFYYQNMGGLILLTFNRGTQEMETYINKLRKCSLEKLEELKAEEIHIIKIKEKDLLTIEQVIFEKRRGLKK